MQGQGRKGEGKDYETLCLNQSELKHMHAIRPYCSREQQRKSSRREGHHQQSPYEMSRSNSKRLDNSSRKSQDRIKGGRQTSEMLGELINLKSQYKLLKANYSKILEQRRAETGRQAQARREAQQQAQRKGKEVQRWQKSAHLLEQEMDRMRKECARVVEMERFKVKKLEETLQEKELMIAYLRNEVECIKRQSDPSSTNNPNPNQSMQQQPLYFLQNSAPMLNYSYFKPNLSLLSSIPADPPRTSFPEEDSLCLSRDRSKEADSIIHSFLSNDPSLHPRQDQRPLRHPPLHSLEESPIQPGIEPISEKSQQSEMDFKKGKEPRDFLEAEPQARLKPNPKKLQILIADENLDTQNIPSQGLRDELSMETRKKMNGHSNSLVMCKQKKKLTAKKIKPF